jgi:hypothetical protein
MSWGLRNATANIGNTLPNFVKGVCRIESNLPV